MSLFLGQPSGLKASDIMVSPVWTVHPDTPVSAVVELFQAHRIKGAPVVDGEGDLVGMVTEEDIVFGQMGFSDHELAGGAGEKDPSHDARPAREIMTHHPIAADETTPAEEICRLMWQLRIHRIPILRAGKVTGIVSTIDICRLLVEGKVCLMPLEE
ncbi:MAG: HPP family protein [Acidobacteriota bacterium]